MTDKYLILARDLQEAAFRATVLAKNVNYWERLDRPEEDGIGDLISRSQDILQEIDSIIRHQMDH